MQVENRYLILHRLVNDISIYSFIWYNERKIEGVVHAYIYLCWDFKAIGKNSIEDNEKPTAQQIPLQQLYTLWINKPGLCQKKNKLRNCFNGQFSGLCITMACKCIMHFLHGAGSQYLVDTNNEQVFTLLARPSTIFPLLHRSCDVGDRCAKGGEG